MYMNTALNGMLARTRDPELTGSVRTRSARHACRAGRTPAPPMSATRAPQPARLPNAVAKRTALAAASVVVAAITAMAAPAPALAATDLNLTAGLSVTVPFPDGRVPWSLVWTASAEADRRVQVFDVETRRYVTDFVPASASNVVIRTVVPPALSNFTFGAQSGFLCGRSANVVTCTGSVPSTGVAAAVTMRAQPPSLTTKYAITSTVDPSNVIAERSEFDNTTTCAAAVVTAPSCS